MTKATTPLVGIALALVCFFFAVLPQGHAYSKSIEEERFLIHAREWAQSLNFTAAMPGDVQAFDRPEAENWCIGGFGLQVCGSVRVAAAIDYLTYGGVQFINTADHGRELQFAISNEHGECYNPTEAGSANDGPGPTSSSRLLGINTGGNVYRTTSLPVPPFSLYPPSHHRPPPPHNLNWNQLLILLKMRVCCFDWQRTEHDLPCYGC